MKKILLLLFALPRPIASSHAQQQFTHTATKENISCNYDCTILDVPALNGNPAALLFAIPVLVKGVNQNPHPIGAYYFKGQWCLFNLDSKPIAPGSSFTVDYFAAPDESHFPYTFSQANIQSDGSAVIDNWYLNNNPTVRFNTFLSWDPTASGSTANRQEVTVQYNVGSGKWSVSNNNGRSMMAGVTYNIGITWAGRNTLNTPRASVQIKELDIVPDTSSRPCNCPAALPPNGIAGGDLGGNYPDPVVQKLSGRPLSAAVPQTGQVLKWDGNYWQPADDKTVMASTASSAIPVQTFFKSPPPNSHGILPGTAFPLIELAMPVTITKRSRFIISCMIELWGENCNGCTKTSGGMFQVFINTTTYFSLYVFAVPRTPASATISNFMIDLNPGIYNVQFRVDNPASALTVSAKHSSLIVIPLE